MYKVWKKQYGEKNTDKIIGYIFKEPGLDLKIKKDFDFWKKEIRGEEIAYNTLRLNKSGDPKKLVGQTLIKSTDPTTLASISEVEPFTRQNKQYFKLSLFFFLFFFLLYSIPIYV